MQRIEQNTQGGYIRLASSRSRSEKVLTSDSTLFANIKAIMEKYAELDQNNFLPKISDIMVSHHIPTRTIHKPVIAMGIEINTHRCVNERYSFERVTCDFLGNAFEILEFSEREDTSLANMRASNVAWALVPNFAIALVKSFRLTVNGQDLVSCGGAAFYIFCQTQLPSKKVALDKMQQRTIIQWEVKEETELAPMAPNGKILDIDGKTGVTDGDTVDRQNNIIPDFGTEGEVAPIWARCIGSQIDMARVPDPEQRFSFIVANPIPFQFFTEATSFIPFSMIGNAKADLYSEIRVGADYKVDSKLINIWRVDTADGYDVSAIKDSHTPTIQLDQRYLVAVHVYTPRWFGTILTARSLFLVYKGFMTTEKQISSTSETIDIAAHIPFEAIYVVARRLFKSRGFTTTDIDNGDDGKCRRGIAYYNPCNYTDNGSHCISLGSVNTPAGNIFQECKPIVSNAIMYYAMDDPSKLCAPLNNDIYGYIYDLENGRSSTGTYFNASNIDRISVSLVGTTYTSKDRNWVGREGHKFSDYTVGITTSNQYIASIVIKYINIAMIGSGTMGPRYVTPGDDYVNASN